MDKKTVFLTPDPPDPTALPLATGPGRPLQITMRQDTEILLARLCARWVEKGYRPSACTKSALIDTALRFLAQAEKIDLLDLAATGPGPGALTPGAGTGNTPGE